jgi:antimicrobial peptide system SdpA family protein
MTRILASEPDAISGRPNDGIGPEPERDIRLGWRVLVGALAAGFLVLNVLSAALPATSFALVSSDTKRAITLVMPQGWAFFTKSPRSSITLLYRRDANGDWQSITAGPMSQPRHLMGADKRGRSQGTEMAILLAGAPKNSLKSCEVNALDCLRTAAPGPTVANTGLRTLCGDIGIVVQDVLPWAWRDAPTVMPSKVLRVNATC